MLPSRDLPARKHVAAAVVVVALAVGGAFAFGLVGGQPTAVDQVPGGVDVVAEIDPAIVDDSQSRALAEAGFASAGYASVAIDDVVSRVESRTDLRVDAVETVVAYGRYDAPESVDRRYAGAIVHAGWSATELRDAVAGTTGISYTETDVDGTTVYYPRTNTLRAPAIAVLDDGEFAIGTERAVEDAVAVANGDANAVGGTIRNALADTEDGLVTFAATLPRDEVAAFDARTQRLTRLGSVRVVAGAYDTTEDSIALRVRLRTNGTEAARDVTDVTRGGLPIVASQVENGTVADLLRSVEVERAGEDVTMTLETTVAELQRIARYYGLGGD